MGASCPPTRPPGREVRVGNCELTRLSARWEGRIPSPKKKPLPRKVPPRLRQAEAGRKRSLARQRAQVGTAKMAPAMGAAHMLPRSSKSGHTAMLNITCAA